MDIAIITGGSGSEREVSLASAKNIQNILSISDKYVFDYPKQIDEFSRVKSEIDICIPLIHGEGGEDGEIQLFLETLSIPYIFSNPDVHKRALDKRKTKDLLSDFGIKSAKEYSINDNIDWPIFVKPVTGGSSIYTKKASSKDELINFLNNHSDIDFIIEKALEGREFSVGVVETENGLQALPVIEIVPKGEFFDYDSKYDDEKLAQEICPANVSDELEKILKKQSMVAHKEIGCKHISRSDFIVTDDNQIYFLEINTIPGMTSTSLVPKEMVVAALSFKELFIYWINEAL